MATSATHTGGASSSSASGGRIAGGTTSSGLGGNTNAAIDPDLVLWYKFDDATGTTAADASGHARHGTLATIGTGAVAYSTTRQVGTGSLNLTGSGGTSGGYVVLPSSLQAMGANTELTVSCWVSLKSSQIWQRVFDFGSNGNTSSMFLTVQQNLSSPNSTRFAITTGGWQAEQRIDMAVPSPLSTGTWHHLAVVLGAGAVYTGTLYIDNVSVGTNSAMTLRPSDMGESPNNWLGRSQYETDPLLNALLDDVRIFKRALTTSEIAALFAAR